ncbi:hypothetical protein [Nostoc sp. ChiQUE01b]|uniref:hypothetical protein n=1 Tax=Nostoc sp. ChiQUE01b TaxID=3075376 RepID=UPI002AD5A50F|nr:hypothetical protein [Nostoc sp. ChiQUE01b]MDZ8263774.1 hypothetical protein [Nostoc sp. ChiQUE01b]
MDIELPANPEQSPSTQACVKTYQVQERYDLLWVCLGTPKQDIAPFSEWYDHVYQKIFCCHCQVAATLTLTFRFASRSTFTERSLFYSIPEVAQTTRCYFRHYLELGDACHYD